MKISLVLLLIFIPIQALAEDTSLIITDVFSIEVPSDWKIKHENVRRFVFAHSPESYDGWPVEMLVVDYCKIGGAEKEKNTIQCSSCSETTLVNILKQKQNHDGEYKISKLVKGGLTEYQFGNIGNSSASISKLYCGKTGQVYMELMSSKKPSDKFLKILKTIKIK